MFKEFDGRAEAKNRAEYITPKPLREFIAKYVKGENLSVLEPAIGSGQMLESIADRIESIDGYDVEGKVVDALTANFGTRCTFHHKSFLSASIDKHYDYAISNYPYSLKFKDFPDDANAVLQDDTLKQFYPSNKVTGVMDFAFILKSFNYANEGIYLCYPGIGYRAAEKKFRQYIIDNNYLVEYGILENAGFDHTAIPILFMHLSKDKDPKQPVISFNRDLKAGTELVEEVKQFDSSYTLEIPKEVQNKLSDFDPVATELEARKAVEQALKRQIKFSAMVWNIDEEVRKELPSVKDWLNELAEFIRKASDVC